MLILCAAVALGGATALARRQFVLALLVFTGILPVLLNLLLLPRYSVELATLFALGSASLIIGALLASFRKRGPPPASDQLAHSEWNAFATAVTIFAVLGTILHFAVGGIPLVAPNVEIARLDFTASGFLGIPGRIYLFGIPLALAASLRAERICGKEAFSSWQGRLMLTAYVLSRVLSGFKSGLFEVAFTTLLIYVASGHSLKRGHIPQLLAALSVASVVGFAVGLRYDTYQERGVLSSLMDRVSVQAADPAAVVLLDSDPHGLESNSIVLDARYFTSRYFHIGDPTPNSFNQIVSSRVTATPLSPDSYIVPVTTTAIAEQIYDFGTPLALLTLALTGYLLQSAEHRAGQKRTPYQFLGSITILVGGFGYVSKGGLVYAVYNWGAVCLLLIAIAVMFNMLRQRRLLIQARTSSRSGTPRPV